MYNLPNRALPTAHNVMHEHVEKNSSSFAIEKVSKTRANSKTQLGTAKSDFPFAMHKMSPNPTVLVRNLFPPFMNPRFGPLPCGLITVQFGLVEKHRE